MPAFPPTSRDKLFQPFPKASGDGLALSITYDVVHSNMAAASLWTAIW